MSERVDEQPERAQRRGRVPSGRAVVHEQNKRSVVELTAWAAVAAALLVVGLHAGIAATASTADVPRVTPTEYQYR